MKWNLQWLTKDDPPHFCSVNFDSLWAAFKLWMWFRWHRQWAKLKRYRGKSKEELEALAEEGGAE